MTSIYQYQEGQGKTAGHVKQIIADADGHEYVDFAAITAAMLAAHAHSGVTEGGGPLLAANTHASPSADTHHAQTHGAAQHTDTTRSIWIPVGDLQLGIATGTPAKGVYGTWATMFSAWAFDDTVSEALIANPVIPADWVGGTISVKYYWASDTATSGDCYWFCDYLYVSDGGNLKAAVTSFGAAVASPATVHYEKVSTIGAIAAPSAAGQHLKLYLRRRGNDAADTMTGDALLIGVLLEYTANQ